MVNRNALGLRAEKLGILGVDSKIGGMTYFIDLADRKRIGIATEHAKVILTRKQLEAIAAEGPEIIELYCEGEA